jgi:hypothetical protein
MGAIVRFARAHHKPLSIPEWGVAPASATGIGDDPAYVDGIAMVVRNERVAYQSYWYSRGYATLFARSRRSLSAYRAHFGRDGDAVTNGS